MTKAEIDAAIDIALGVTPFDPPVSVEYCAAVRDVLRESLPGSVLDVFYRVGPKTPETLEVQVRVDGREVVVTTPLV